MQEFDHAMRPSSQAIDTSVHHCSKDNVSILAKNTYTITNSIKSDTTVEQFKKLLPHDYDLMSGGRCGWNVCGSASVVNNTEVLKYLITQEPRLLNHGNTFGQTPLMCAVMYGSIECVKILIELGADVNCCTRLSSFDSKLGGIPDGATPLYVSLCMNKKYPEIAKILINHGGLLLPLASDTEIKRYRELMTG